MIETWATTPAGVYIAHLDRSKESPFRAFGLSLIRNAPGTGVLEYHPSNALLAAHPTMLDLGNLIWMKYRDTTRAWIIEDERAVLDQNEHATDWIQLSGPGTLQLLGDRLVFPYDFADGANLDPSTWTTQWRSFVNRAAGEMLWDMIQESNARSTTVITEGTIETTGADGWTQDFKFETILDDVVRDVTAVHGDVEMVGREFSYYNVQGVDRSDEVIFEEGADLLQLTHDRSDRDRGSFFVGEGVGEGVFAQLRVSDAGGSRRIERFVAAKGADNVGLLQDLTDAAMDEHQRREAISFDVNESRFQVFTHYGLGDTVTAKAFTRGVDTAQRIDAIYLKEEDDRVRVALDLNGLREDELLKLYGEVRRTRSQLGVTQRQPQGQLVPFSFNGADVFDSADTMDVFLFVPDRIYVTIEAKAQLHFREFFAPATAAASDAGSTSGASSATTTVENDLVNHFHVIGSAPAAAGAFTTRKWTPHANSTSGDFNLATATTGLVATGDTSTVHDHDMPHDHEIDPHAHDLTYGVFKEAYPASHSVEVRTYEMVADVWTLRNTLTGLTDDLEEIDLSAVIDGPGSWKLEIKSAAAQPQGGRLGCDVAGYVLGAIKSS